MNTQSYSRRKLILFLGGLLIAGAAYSPKPVSAADKQYTAFARCQETGKQVKLPVNLNLRLAAGL